jgi:hypothetical protein
VGYENLARAKEYEVCLALMANDEFPFASTPVCLLLNQNILAVS